MARFYGTVQGGRGEASRLGHATSGLDVTAQSYSGDIVVRFYVLDDTDMVRLVVREHGHGHHVRLYEGPVAELLKPAARLAFFQQAAKDVLTTA